MSIHISQCITDIDENVMTPLNSSTQTLVYRTFRILYMLDRKMSFYIPETKFRDSN